MHWSDVIQNLIINYKTLSFYHKNSCRVFYRVVEFLISIFLWSWYGNNNQLLLLLLLYLKYSMFNSCHFIYMLIILTTWGIMKIACYCLFNTVLNKLFPITDVYIFSTRQNNNWIYKKWPRSKVYIPLNLNNLCYSGQY